MESLLILLAIVGLEALASWFKKRAQKRNAAPIERRRLPEDEYRGEECGSDADDFDEEDDGSDDFDEEDEDVSDDEGDFGEDEFPGNPPQPLQDLIRKFQEEQAKLSEKRQKESFPPTSPPVFAETRAKETSEQNLFPASPDSFVPKPNPEKPRKEIASDDTVRNVFPSPPQNVGSKKSPAFAFNRREAAKGFLWANVLDAPRFKRRSPFPITGNLRRG